MKLSNNQFVIKSLSDLVSFTKATVGKSFHCCIYAVTQDIDRSGFSDSTLDSLLATSRAKFISGETPEIEVFQVVSALLRFQSFASDPKDPMYFLIDITQVKNNG